jgi:hypothetical protein
MRDRSGWWFVAAILALVPAGAALGAEPETPASAVTRVGAALLVQHAWQTQARQVRAMQTSAGEIPRELWGEALKELKPLRVYLHHVNVVAVLRAEGQTEEGIYICLPISSYVPTAGTDGFEYARLAPDVFTYRRSPATLARKSGGRFGIFLPREDVYSGTPDVNERIARYLQSHPAEIPLASHPVVSEEDVARYEWWTHTLTLNRTFWFKIRRPSLRGSPFVVVADGEPVYVGAFFSDASSFSCPTPVIRFDEQMTNRVVTIERAYPGAFVVQGKKDPREDPKVKKALQAAGKLRE